MPRVDMLQGGYVLGSAGDIVVHAPTMHTAHGAEDIDRLEEQLQRERFVVHVEVLRCIMVPCEVPTFIITMLTGNSDVLRRGRW